MKPLSIHITIDPALYTKDPASSELGKKMVQKSIEMIDEMGFEKFTFKKLGTAIGSNESSIYRYFESKHSLLVYLVSWYWSWVEYKLVFATTNITDSREKLAKSIRILTENVTEDHAFSFVNEVILHKIIIAESSKAYHTKDVDTENQKGFYKTYKRVVQLVSDMVSEVNPDFEFPTMLISTLIEGVHHQRYFSEHLPALTNVTEGEDCVMRFYNQLVFNTIL